MQALLPFPDYVASARVLDTGRIGSQRMEILRILNLHHRVVLVPGTKKERYLNGATKIDEHPAVQMWDGYVVSLCELGLTICEEWVRRGGSDLVKPCIETHMMWAAEGDFSLEQPPWFGDPEFHLSQQSWLLRKDPGYYSQRFPHTPDNLPLVWPGYRA